MAVQIKRALALATSLALLLFCNNNIVAGIPLEDFYSFGSAVGDTAIPPNDDGSSALIALTMSFPFFDEDHTSLFVNNNGVLSFDVSVSQFTPDPFPLTGNLQLIAPYWADVDTRGTGTVWYRETTDPQLLQRAGDEIQAAFISQGSFAPSYLFIATWDHVGHFSRSTDKTNTFQCVMATDGINSFVIYLYADGLIQWTTGDASGGSGGLGGTPAQVGFNAGDGIRFANVPGSRTAEIINITQTSNVGVPGVWIFRVDSEEIVVAGCSIEPDATLTIAPRLGSVLGGTVVSFSGPCLEETDNITCVFDGVEVEGIFINMMLGVCISPPLFAVGRLPFQLRVVNASGFTRFEGDAVFFSIATFEDRFSVDIQPPGVVFQTGASFQVMWTPQSVVTILDPNSYTVDVSLYRLTDPDNAIWTEIAILASNIPNTGAALVTIPDLGIGNADPPEVFPVAVQVGLSDTMSNQPIGRRQIDPVLLQRLAQLGRVGVRAGFWTAVAYVAGSATLRLLCEAWCISQPAGIGNLINGMVLPCPPTLNQARMDNRFSMENPLVSGTFHPGTSACFRQVIRGNQCQPGSQCCYDNNGNLIVGPPNGGTVDKVSPQGPLSCFLWHFIDDVLPSIFCCVGLFSNCGAYYAKRPSTTAAGYRLPVPACVYGDPHLVTLDGLKYTFNGNGEFVLIETADGSFTLQGRMVPATDAGGTDVPATVFSALVARQNGSDTVQFELSRRGLDVLVNGERIELGDVPEQEFNNVVVRASGNNSLSARFANGAFIELEEENEIISQVFVSVPGNLQGATRGLMGNFNGDTSDDFIPRGSIVSISTDSSLQEIHEQFGITWIIDDAADSLFTYGLGESFAFFFNPSFTPRFMVTFSDPALEAQANAICGDDQFCLYDIATTGRMDIGLSTLQGAQEFDMIMNSSVPIECDPPCENGACVANDSCNCAAGFSGDICDQIIFTDCASNPCENGGTCMMHAGSTICECPDGFEGSLCQTQIAVLNPCDSNPCDENADCQRIGLTSRFVCRCRPPFAGDGFTCTRVSLGDDPHFSIVLPNNKILCYTVQGEHGFVFNLISNEKLHMNAMFVPDSRRSEVTWIGSLGIIVQGAHYQGSNVTELKFDAKNNQIHIRNKVSLSARNIDALTFVNDKLTISEAPLKAGFHYPSVKVNLEDVGLHFTIKFTGEHLDMFWHSVGEQNEESHGLIGQFFHRGVEIDEVRKLLLLPGKEPVPVMRRPVWSFMEREMKDDQLCWTAMNPGYQGEGLIDGTYFDYLVNDVYSKDFVYKPKGHQV